MAQAVLSILTLEKWMKNRQKSIFNSLHIPTQCNQAKIGNAILLKCAPFEVIYPDPEFLAEAVDIWSSIKVDEWQKVADALELEYDAISNYDRIETSTDSDSVRHVGGSTVEHSGSDETKHTNDETRSTSANDTNTNSTVINSENKVSAYDAAASDPYVPKDKSTGNNNSTLTTESLVTNTSEAEADDTVTYGHMINEANDYTDTHSFTHESHVKGNIGVTTSQQMLQSEIDLRLNNDISEIIVNEFKKEFCILTY